MEPRLQARTGSEPQKKYPEQDKNRKFVVVSAPERDARDNKVTDLLVELANGACWKEA